MKGVDASKELEIDARPSILFVDSDGKIITLHEGGVTDEDEIRGYWTSAGGTL